MTVPSATTPAGINPNPRTMAQHVYNWQRLSAWLQTGGLDANGGLAVGVQTITLTGASIFAITGSPLTTGSGTLNIGLATESAHTVLAGPTSGTATPTFRLLQPSDLGTGSTAGMVLTVNGSTMGFAAPAAGVSAVATTGTATGVSLTNTVPANIGTLTLAPGVYDLTGIVVFAQSAATTVDFTCGFSVTSGSFLADPGAKAIYNSENIPVTWSLNCPLPTWQIDLRTQGGNTTLYVIAAADISVGSVTATAYWRYRQFA